MHVSAMESFWRRVVVEIESSSQLQVVGWLQRLHFLVPEPTSRGGGAVQEMNHEKSSRSLNSQLLGAHLYRNRIILISGDSILFVFDCVLHCMLRYFTVMTTILDGIWQCCWYLTICGTVWVCCNLCWHGVNLQCLVTNKMMDPCVGRAHVIGE